MSGGEAAGREGTGGEEWVSPSVNSKCSNKAETINVYANSDTVRTEKKKKKRGTMNNEDEV